MPPPTKRQINDLTRSGDPVKRFKGFKNNSPLLLYIARLAQRMTKGPLQIDAARRLYLFCVFTNDCYPNGGDACFFDLSLDQSHGLIADASSRGEQNDINLVALEFLHHLPGRLGDQGGNVSAVNMAHEGIVAACELANDSLLL